MPKLPRLTSEEAEKLLLKSGFQHIRSRGSHRIYQKGRERFVLPFHKGKTLHPKIIKSLFELIEDESS
ncbi:type II toxin-antitoxin system HicA family toxin [Caldithrix abyssi]|uniref:YcfA family protein n=1 Tax=Caldithrix abyssi DSM 13497 TaxID=880073 RepID=H1XNF4_CALAY|nr:YcfA family protein [Caldithrix abyssi DSM 13497]